MKLIVIITGPWEREVRSPIPRHIQPTYVLTLFVHTPTHPKQAIFDEVRTNINIGRQSLGSSEHACMYRGALVYVGGSRDVFSNVLWRLHGEPVMIMGAPADGHNLRLLIWSKGQPTAKFFEIINLCLNMSPAINNK